MIYVLFLGEKRVALVPAVVQTLCKKGFNVNIEDGAGTESQFRNMDYEAAGAKIVDSNAGMYHLNYYFKFHICLQDPSQDVQSLGA